MTNLLKKNKKLMKEYNYNKNTDIDLEKITEGMGLSIWWKCSKCGHEWQTRINHRTKDGTGCPICSRKDSYTKLLEEKGSLLFNHPELMNEWNYKKNDIDPNAILDGSNVLAWWVCNKCGHEWKARIAQRTKKNTGCPKCSQEQGKKTLLKGLIQEKGSLAETNPELGKEWN